MIIWPAIDILGGKCVRLTQGDYSRSTIYGANPADMAVRWSADGAAGLHIVDLDGARDGTTINREAVAKLLEEVDVPCQLGGGIRDEKTIADFLEMGIKRLVIGTKALTDPDWLESMTDRYPDVLLVGIDARDGRVATDGWKKTSDVRATDLAERIASLPIAGIIYTDITKDGMLSGPNFDAMQEMQNATNKPILASGGVTTVEDVTRLAELNLSGCIIGRSFYEGRLTLQEAMTAADGADIIG